jgi:feruloyl esterase
MFTYVPTTLPPKPALVVVLHGCTQSAAAYDFGAGWSTLAERHGFVVVAPQQQPANNPKVCFNWFQTGDISRGRGEALSIREIVERAVLDHGIDRARVFVTGFSAGGAMTSVMLATYPEVFAAGAIIAGLPYGAASNVQQAFDAMFQGCARPAAYWADRVRSASTPEGPWPRVSVWHGSADAIVKIANAGETLKQWANVHGVDLASGETDVIAGYPHEAWRNARGDIVLESYTITGMAHGTPLAIGDDLENACGAAGPFFVDAGISSSRHIAGFFGLAETPRMPAVSPSEARRDGAETTPQECRNTRSSPTNDYINDVIAKAFRAAGLTAPPP